MGPPAAKPPLAPSPKPQVPRPTPSIDWARDQALDWVLPESADDPKEKDVHGASGSGHEASPGSGVEGTEGFPDGSGNENYAHSMHALEELPPDLRIIVKAWPRLSEEVKAEVLRLAEGE